MKQPFSDSRRLETVTRFARVEANPALDRVAASAAAALGMAGAEAFLVGATSVHALAAFGLKSGPVERALPENLSVMLPSGVTSMTDRNGELGGMIASRELIASLFSAPLIAKNGHLIGSLCAFDQRLLSLDPEQGMLLENLARTLTDLLEAQLDRSQVRHDRAAPEASHGGLRDQPEELGRESSRLAQCIIESADAAIIAFSLEGRVLRWNAGAERLYGYESADAIGREIDFLIPEFFAANWRAINQHVVTTHQALDLESVHRHRDGRLIEVRLSFAPLLDEHQRPIGVWSTATDVHARSRPPQVLTNGLGQPRTLLAYAQHQMHARQLLERTSTVLAGIHDESGVWEALFDLLTGAPGFERVGLYRLEDGTLSLVHGTASEPSIVSGQGLIAQAASNARGATAEASDHGSGHSHMVAPVSIPGTVFGVISLTGTERFDHDTLRTLEAIASQSGLALAHVRALQPSSGSISSQTPWSRTIARGTSLEPREVPFESSAPRLGKPESGTPEPRVAQQLERPTESAVPVPRETLRLSPLEATEEVGLVVLADLALALRYAAGVGGLESFTAGLVHRAEWGGDLVVLRNRSLRMIILKCKLEDLPEGIRRDPEIISS